MSGGTHGPRAALAGFALPLAGLRLLLRERSLWGLAAVPFLLSIVACAVAVGAVLAHAGELRALLTGWAPALAAQRWFEWVWIGPAKLLLELVSWILFAALAAVVVASTFLLTSVAAAPFHELLSRRVELVVTGRVIQEDAEGWRAALAEGLRSLFEELRRLTFFLVAQAALAITGLLLPGGALLAPPAMALLTMLFLPLDYASHVLERRRVRRFREKRRWLLEHRDVVLGFGAAGFLICLVPGVNFLAMPALVAGGTLLALRHPPRPPGPRAGAWSGRARGAARHSPSPESTPREDPFGHDRDAT